MQITYYIYAPRVLPQQRDFLKSFVEVNAALCRSILSRKVIQSIKPESLQFGHIHSMQHPRVHTRRQMSCYIHLPQDLRQRSDVLVSTLLEVVRHADAANPAKRLV
jgi:hypothetical protein